MRGISAGLMATQMTGDVMSETTKVWASNSVLKVKIMAPIRIMPSDRTQFDETLEESSHWASVQTDYFEALIRDGGTLPKALVGSKLDTRVNKISDFFIGAGFFIVSQRCADVFMRFDLGHGGLSPVEIYQGNRKSLAAPGPLYILHFGCQKQAFVPEASNPAAFWTKITVRGGYERYRLSDVADDDYALAPKALEGPDLWVDLTVSGSFFMSNRLAKALTNVKLTKNMFLTRCRVIE